MILFTKLFSGANKMIIYDDKKNAIINMVVQFFMNYVVKYDFIYQIIW